MTPAEAQEFDRKVDDGYAGSGNMVAVSTAHDFLDCANDVPNAGAKPELGYNESYKNIACTLFLNMD